MPENRPAPLLLSAESQVLPGIRRAFSIPAPAAGADWSVTVPGGRLWRIGSLVATLVASATVANRFATLTVTQDGVLVYRSPIGVALTAGGPMTYSTFAGCSALSTSTGAGVLSTPFPSMWLKPGAILASLTANLQAGDQWSAIGVFIEEAFISEPDLQREESDELRALLTPPPTAGKPTGG